MAAQNPNFTSKPSSSSSFLRGVLPTSLVPPLTGVSTSSTTVPNILLNTNFQGMNSGNSDPANRPTRSAGVPSQKVAYNKSFNKSKVLLKSKNSVWRASDANSNLIISFSDDDGSSSDDGERKQKQTTAINRLSGLPPAVKGSQKPPALLNVKLDAGSERKERKVAPKKVSLSSTSISSMNKIHGSGVSNGMMLDQLRSVKQPNVDRTLSDIDLGCKKNVERGSSKLQDLRQRIARCENELKRKLVEKSKEHGSETCQYIDAVVRNKDTNCNKEVSSDINVVPKEPDKKRLKMVLSGLEQLRSTGCHLKRAESIEPPCQDQNIVDIVHHDSGNSLGELLSPPDGGQVLLASQRKGSEMPQDAPCVAANCRSSDWMLMSREASTLRKQTLALTNPICADHLDKSSRVLGCNEVDVQSLFEIEESHDIELEEAQEHRHRCEVEERNALKAYRRAQRALADANARCAYLYRRRELYSAQLRLLVMEDSHLLWSSSQQRQIGDPLNLMNTMVDGDFPNSAHHTRAEFEAGNRLGYDSNAPSADGDAHAMLSGNEYGHNLGSEACNEPDASSSELVAQGNSSAFNGVHPPSRDQNLSPSDDDDGGTSPLEHRSVFAVVTSSRVDNCKQKEKNTDVESTTNFSADELQDPLLLEVCLRSKLFSRLGMAGSSEQNGTDVNGKPAVNRVSEEDVAGANCNSRECSRESEDCKFKPPSTVQSFQCVKEQSSNESPVSMFDPEDSGFQLAYIPYISIIPLSSIFKSAMKSACHVSLDVLHIADKQSSDACNDKEFPVQCDQDMEIGCMSNSIEVFPSCESLVKVDSYTGKSSVDLSWPLCIYELRGRCNNDECPWQHVKGYSSDCKSESLSSRTMQEGRTQPPSILTPPRYLLCVDTLKAESHCSLQERQLVSSQRNVFSISLAVSSALLKHLCLDEPYLNGSDGCVESYACGYPLYFHCRNGTGSSQWNGTTGDDQALERALDVLNQETNKNEGTKKVLSELSRALEADPRSLPLWIIYLVIYYSTKNSKLSKKDAYNNDDLFSCAVKHNEGSYELWLLYINSRGLLNDRFSAYKRALSSLCHHASENNEHVEHMSATILDLSLQMLHSFCSSGNVAMAIRMIYRLVLTDRDLDESHSLLLSEILECLTVSDKCIFWICCVYLVIYRKLPDEMVEQFEFEKDTVVMEWPTVRSTLDGKQLVSQLMEAAFDSLELHTSNKSLDNTSLKSVHLLAVNHAKLMLAIDGKESYMLLLDRYRNSYPSCLELILLSARAGADVGETANYERFEEALQNWVAKVPGIQCLWNQFIQHVIQNGKSDVAKEIMDKWFDSAWKPRFVHNKPYDVENGSKISSEHPPSRSTLNDLLSSDMTVDLVFGLLNLSLYKLLQNNVSEAHLAIDKALSLADSEMILYFVREHAVFLLNYGPQLGKDVSVDRLPDILKAYMIREQASPGRDPLARKFIEYIPRPRLKQLVNNTLHPISPDSRLVNSVLDIWFGSTLLPQNPKSVKDLVDFVEAILEISPANYQLVVSVCRFLCSSAVSDNAKSVSVLFWASSLLVNTMYHALPVPPEYVWIEAVDLLGKLTNVPEISVSFHERSLLLYPFSLGLWKSYLNLSTTASKKSYVIEAARDKGIEL